MGFPLKELALILKVGQDIRQALGLEDSRNFSHIFFLSLALRQRGPKLLFWRELATLCQRKGRSMTKSPLEMLVGAAVVDSK